MSDTTDISNDTISDDEDKKYQLEFENEKDKKDFRKWLFWILFIFIILMYLCSFKLTYDYINTKMQLFDNNCSTPKEDVGSIVLLSITLMIPTILSLALMRFLFGNSDQKSEKNIPSLIFNIGKELKETLIAIMDKKN